MEKTHTPGNAKRGPGRPVIIDGEAVSVNLRMSTLDRDTLKQIGGSAWLRGQLAIVRKNAAMLKKDLRE